MKKIVMAGMAGFMLVSTAASAMSVSGQAGQDYTTLAFGMGTDSSGLALSGNWTHNDDHGDVAGLGLGFNLPLGPFMATVGGKAIYLNPNVGDEGYAVAAGGGLSWAISDSLSVFGDYYYSPDSLSSGVNDYQEASAGARFTVLRPVSIEAGYRYIDMETKNNNGNSKMADGPYVGVSAHF